MNKISSFDANGLLAEKFSDPELTIDGKPRATVALNSLETLWFNTGTLCNIQCANCYILSSPKNDDLVYLTLEDVVGYLDEISDLGLATREIGFTGGEPFMNPNMCAMAGAALERGLDVLILTNAMRPMMRPIVRQALSALIERYGDKLTLRVSLDHYDPEKHDEQRGAGTFAVTLDGMRWLRDQGARLSAAGRSMWDEDENQARRGFARLFAEERLNIDTDDPAAMVIFPEMDTFADVPEISTACWEILGKSPDSVMCANTRMVVRRKGAGAPAVLACTLLAYDEAFELGRSLAEADRPVSLNHPHCAKFCVLGGARCSA
ncbi:MAG: radical SAM protein [Pseudomonadota bacterium]